MNWKKLAPKVERIGSCFTSVTVPSWPDCVIRERPSSTQTRLSKASKYSHISQNTKLTLKLSRSPLMIFRSDEWQKP
jgi:hypothetical protein